MSTFNFTEEATRLIPTRYFEAMIGPVEGALRRAYAAGAEDSHGILATTADRTNTALRELSMREIEGDPYSSLAIRDGVVRLYDRAAVEIKNRQDAEELWRVEAGGVQKKGVQTAGVSLMSTPEIASPWPFLEKFSKCHVRSVCKCMSCRALAGREAWEKARWHAAVVDADASVAHDAHLVQADLSAALLQSEVWQEKYESAEKERDPS